MKTTYSIEILSDKLFKLTADYGHGSRCETTLKSFSDAIETLEDWYKGDKASNR